MLSTTSASRWLAILTTIGLLVAACGESDDGETAPADDASTSTSTQDTEADPATADDADADPAATDDTADGATSDGSASGDTTEEGSASTTPADDADGAQQLADAIVLTGADIGPGWTESPAVPSDTDYGAIDGCEFMVDLVDNDGNVVDVDSPEFEMGQIGLENSVRVYPDVETATNVVLSWAGQNVADCIVAGLQADFQELLDNGELAPYEAARFDLQTTPSHDEEPRVTNIVVTTVLAGPDRELAIINDISLIQSEEVISLVGFISPGGRWEGRQAVLATIEAKISAALAGRG